MKAQQPMRVTFPGTVRFAPPPPATDEAAKTFQPAEDANGRPLRTTVKTDAKGKFVGTVVTVPPGKRLTWPEPKIAPAFGGRPKPVYTVSLIDDEPQHVHAELAQEFTPAVPATPSTIGRPSAMGQARPGLPATRGTPAKFGEVTATSTVAKMTDGAPVVAKGKDAAEAVANLKAAIAAASSPPAPATEEEKKPLEQRIAEADAELGKRELEELEKERERNDAKNAPMPAKPDEKVPREG